VVGQWRDDVSVRINEHGEHIDDHPVRLLAKSHRTGCHRDLVRIHVNIYTLQVSLVEQRLYTHAQWGMD
jgi:hypothetical protein